MKTDTLPYVGAAASAGGGIAGNFVSISDLSIIAGMLFALGTFLVGWYYKAKEDRRAERMFQLQLKNAEKKGKTDEKN